MNRRLLCGAIPRQSKDGHPERSEGSRVSTEILRCAQNDSHPGIPGIARVLFIFLTLLPLASLLADDQWQAALQPREFHFPQDHAAHDDHRVEWWYYTGNLQTADGRRFGYQLTFFRTGVVREPKNPSRWTIRDLYTAHFAISELSADKFHFFERLNRHGVGWAGAQTDRYHVWNGDWEVQMKDARHVLAAQANGCRLELDLVSTKPPVIHGPDGLSRKGSSPGNASHYYSLTRMQTTGTLTVEGQPYRVTGLSWMDHEFSTSFLEKGQQGWDWFAIQLDDGRELMIYQIRRSDGTTDPFSSGTLIARDGTRNHLPQDAFRLEPGRRWLSSTSDGSYPIAWTIHIPGEQLQLQVQAAMADQEMNTTATTGIAYWEGAVVVTGQSAKQPVTGRGYLEMTGYAGKSLGGTFR